MKKLLGLIAVAAIAVSTQAQEPVKPEQKYTVDAVQQPRPEDKEGIIFKNGKAWMVKGGKTTLLETTMTMGNGMKVSPSGRIVMESGEKAWLIENDFVHLDGAVEREIPVKTAGEKKQDKDKPNPGGG